MKKQSLTERFQQLAGIKPIYGNKLNENISMFTDYVSSLYDADVEEKEGFQSGIWEKEEYGDPKAYGESAGKFISLVKYLNSVGGKATLEGNPDINLELLPGGDIQWSANVVLTEGKYDDVKTNVLDAINNMSPDEKQTLNPQAISKLIYNTMEETGVYLFGDQADELEAEVKLTLSGKSQGAGEELEVIGTDNRDSRHTVLSLSNGSSVEVDVIELYQNLKNNQ